MKIGDPLDRSVQHGPQNHLAHLTKLVEYCDAGVREGARLLLGGKRCNRCTADITDLKPIKNRVAF